VDGKHLRGDKKADQKNKSIQKKQMLSIKRKRARKMGRVQISPQAQIRCPDGDFMVT